MHVLVYESVLRDDDEFQLAHAYWVVQVSDMWWCSNADPDTHTDSYANANSDAYTNSDTYANSDTDTYANSNADTVASAERAEQFDGNGKLGDPGVACVE